jgi:hypothetical protein
VQPRHDIGVRFQKSGKNRLVLLLLSDRDPDGEEISQSFARSMREDFGIENLDPIKVALDEDQVRELDLPPSLEAKSKSSNYGKFVVLHGRFAYELEAVEPEKLQEILTEAIDDVLDLDLFNQALEREKQDAFEIDRKRHQILAVAGHISAFLRCRPSSASGRSTSPPRRLPSSNGKRRRWNTAKVIIRD